MNYTHYIAVGLGRYIDTNSLNFFQDALFEFSVLGGNGNNYEHVCSVHLKYQNQFGNYRLEQPRVIRDRNISITEKMMADIKPVILQTIREINPHTTLADYTIARE